jgi:hypothetical protein
VLAIRPVPAALRLRTADASISRGGCVDSMVTGVLILLSVLAIPYVALNVRRLRRGRSWAFTFCQVAKEWEERERVKRLAARAADRARAGNSD